MHTPFNPPRTRATQVLCARSRSGRRQLVAVKRVDLDALNCDLDVFVREASLMRQVGVGTASIASVNSRG